MGLVINQNSILEGKLGEDKTNDDDRRHFIF